MPRRATAILCAILMLQLGAADAGSSCATEAHESHAATTGPGEHEHGVAGHELPSTDIGDVPEDGCGGPTPRACCIPALSCSMNFAAGARTGASVPPTTHDASVAGAFDASPLDPATPDTPPPRA
jgi:hypothetical protein